MLRKAPSRGDMEDSSSNFECCASSREHNTLPVYKLGVSFRDVSYSQDKCLDVDRKHNLPTLWCSPDVHQV
jgi:hypothetical protein